jgi:hypothetical protein
MSTQEQDIDRLIKDVQDLHEAQTVMAGKSGLVEKITFAGLPILFSCIVYLMMALGNLQHDNTVLQSKISVVVGSDNMAIPPVATRLELEKFKQEYSKERGETVINRVKDFEALKSEMDRRVTVLEYRMNHPSR